MTEDATDQPTEEYDVGAHFEAEDKEEPKPKRKRRVAPKAQAPKLHVNWFSLQHNSRHPDVKLWQQRMVKRGYELPATGVFDLDSDRAARQLQRELFGYDDGVISELVWNATWAAL